MGIVGPPQKDHRGGAVVHGNGYAATFDTYNSQLVSLGNLRHAFLSHGI